MRKSARKGAQSNLWRGGVDRTERLAIADWCAQHRSDFLRGANYKCSRRGSNEKLELHHIQTVAERPDLARDFTNIEVLCHQCHRKHHGLSGDHKSWRAKSRGNTLTIHFSKIRSIEFIGEQMTFTVALEQPQQNFVGNGVVIPAVWLPNKVL